MDSFKNPALTRIDGVLTAYCCVCGEYIGNEYDTNYYKLIRAKYCERHAQESDFVKAKIRRRDYNNNKNQNRKVEMKAAHDLIDQYRIETRIQKEYIAELQRQLDDLKRGIEK